MATISFLAGEGFTIQDMGGSGLGFYGAGGFGQSVQVGSYQDNTYITDSTGALAGPKADNIKYVHANSGMLPTSDIRLLRDIPNYQATLNIRFTHTSAVRVQNATVRIFDRTNINLPAVGVTTKVAEIIHPWTTSQPGGPLGSGDTQWWSPGGREAHFQGGLMIRRWIWWLHQESVGGLRWEVIRQTPLMTGSSGSRPPPIVLGRKVHMRSYASWSTFDNLSTHLRQ